MPRMDAAIYAAHIDNVLKLAKRDGGVSKPQIISELNVTRSVANGLVEKSKLVLDRKDGRTEYFTVPDPAAATAEPENKPKPAPKQSKAPVAAAKPVSDSTGNDHSIELIAELDAQIVDTRGALREAAKKAGAALGEWATHSALVDALRERMTSLATQRMAASS